MEKNENENKNKNGNKNNSFVVIPHVMWGGGGVVGEWTMSP